MISLEHRKGAAWVLDHATKAEVSEVNSAGRWAKLYDTASATATTFQASVRSSWQRLSGYAGLNTGCLVTG